MRTEFNTAAKMAIGLSALIVLGSIWSLAGLWPMRRLSAREAGFDGLENLFSLAPLVAGLWLCFIFARPKRRLLPFVLGSTLWYVFSNVYC